MHINLYNFNIIYKTDILWPFIAAVTSYTKVILYVDHKHLSHIATINNDNDSNNMMFTCVEWTKKRFESQLIKEGFDRLHGFASRTSSIEFNQITYQIYHHHLQVEDHIYSTVHCINIYICNEIDQYLIDSYNLAITAEYNNNSTSFMNGNDIDIIFLKINYKKFEVGKDGDVCIEQMTYQITGIICILRTFKYIAIELYPLIPLKNGSSLSKNSNIFNNNQIKYCNEIQFLLQLRGNFYGDSFYQYTQSINISSIKRKTFNNNEIDIDKENLEKQYTKYNFKRKWLETNRDDVFIIPAYSC